MNIKTRLLSLIALNVLISFCMGLVAYLGIEKLRPERSESHTGEYTEAVERLLVVDIIRESLYNEVLQEAYQVRRRGHSSEGGKDSTARSEEYAQDLRHVLAQLDALSLPLNVKQSLSTFIAQAEGFPRIASTTLEAATSQGKNVDLKLQTLFSESTYLKKMQQTLLPQLQELAASGRSADIDLITQLQRWLVITLVSGLICVVLTFRITLRSIVSPIKEAICSLQNTSEEITNSARKMSGRAAKLSQSANEQAEAIHASFASMTRISSMIAQTTRSSGDSVSNVQRITQRAKDGSQIMEKLALSAEALNSANTQLNDMVRVISQISTKTSVINDIVFKMQLLSFNASIEAARAGQHGKGFAVVAEEFGTLAEVSGQAATEIQLLLETSKTHVSELVNMTNQRISDGRIVSKEAVSLFNEIAGEISLMAQQLERITTVSCEQQIGVEQSSAAMSQIDNVAERNSLLASETLQSANELAQHSHELTFIMNSLIAMTATRDPRISQHLSGWSPKRGGAGQNTQIIELDEQDVALEHPSRDGSSQSPTQKSGMPYNPASFR